MAALVKELLKDFHKLHPDTKCDLLLAIQSLYHSNVLTYMDLQFLCGYIAGYNSDHIARMWYINPPSAFEENLARIVKAIEEASHYLDKDIIHKVSSNQKYPKHKIQPFIDYLDKHAKNFNDHKEIE